MQFDQGYSDAPKAHRGGVVEAQRAAEVPSKLAMLDKYLQELHEGVIGLNGTFDGVLRPKQDSPQSNACETSPPNHCALGSSIEQITNRVGYLIQEVQSLRDRCEL